MHDSSLANIIDFGKKPDDSFSRFARILKIEQAASDDENTLSAQEDSRSSAANGSAKVEQPALQLTAENETSLSAAPIENIQRIEQPALQPNPHSMPKRKSQGGRLRHQARVLKLFSSHKREMKHFFLLCADEKETSFSEKQRLGAVYHEML